MPTLVTQFNVVLSDKRTRQRLLSGSSASASANTRTQNIALPVNGFVEIIAATSLAVFLQNDANVQILTGTVVGEPSYPAAIRAKGFIHLPGPCRIKITNSYLSPSTDGSITVIAVSN